MWYGVQVAAFAGLVLGHVLLLVVAIRQRMARGRAQRLLEAAILFTALWALGLGLAALLVPGGWWLFAWQRAAQAGLVILAFLTAEFASDFAREPARTWLRAGVLGLLLACVFALDAFSLQVAALLGPLPFEVDVPRLATWLLGVGWFATMLTAWWTAVGALRRATGAKHRNRIRYLLTSLLLFTLADALVLADGLPSLYVGLAARLLGFGLLAFASLRYDLPDVRHWLMLAVRLVLLTMLTVLVYLVALLVVGVASGAVPDGPPWPTLGPVLVALLVAAVIDVFLGPRLNRWFDRLFLGRTYDVQAALRAYSQQISVILDSKRLARTTLRWLARTLGVQRSAFLLFNAQLDGRVELEVLAARFLTPSPNRMFQADSRFVVHFQKIGRPLSQYDLDMLTWFQAMPAGERQWLQDLGVDLYVPVLAAERPVALLALGPRAGGQAYSEEDLETLMTLAGQTGTALENARLVDDLRAMQNDLQRLGGELAETNRQLQRLDQTKADFVTIASHELRTPLAQIYGYSDVLSSMTDGEGIEAGELATFIDGITRGAARLKGVIDAMVDVSLIETGGLVLHTARVPVDYVLRSAINRVQGAAEERRMTLTVKDLAGLPPVEADVPRLEQVFVGLLSNAIKYSPDGSEILVSGRVESVSGEEAVEVLVADSGIGIEVDQQAMIFDKFYRSENAMEHSTDPVRFKGAGPGLGLAIARGIVAAHNGRIWVESEGRDEERCPGSTFFVRLPVAGPSEEVVHA